MLELNAEPRSFAAMAREFYQEKAMTKHMPAIPVANRSDKGPLNKPESTAEVSTEKHLEPPNSAEQGDTANIRQNTTNKGAFRGRRMK